MKQYRKEPTAGEVVAIPLKEDTWVYVCRARSKYYFYKYMSKGLLTDSNLFSKDNWIRKTQNCVSISDFLPRNAPTICKVQLTQDEELPWQSYRQDKPWGDPTPGVDYWIGNGIDRKAISESEENLYPKFGGISLTEIPSFLEQFRSEMVEITGRPIQPELAPELIAEKVDLELDYHGGQISVEAEDIEEAVTAAAEAAELDLEVLEAEVYAVTPEDLPLAKRVLRKALKSVFPEEEWPFVYVLIKGPRVGQSRRFDLVPKPKSKSQ